MIFYPEVLFEQQRQEQESSKKNSQLELQALQSKMKSLREHLQALADKKIRLDLEIKRTRLKLSKLQKYSTTRLKTSLSLENMELKKGQNIKDFVLEQFGQEFFDVTYSLDQEIDKTIELLDDLESLPLFEDN